MLKKLITVTICLALLLQTCVATTSAAAAAQPPKIVYDDYIDISIAIGVKAFNVYALTKQFSVAPYTQYGINFAQIDSILPWLGFTSTYDLKKKILTVKSAKQSFTVKAKSYSYIVNGKVLRFKKPPMEMSKKLMVPVEELFKALGYTVKSDMVKKTVRISKVKNYDMGNFVFYNKSVNKYNFYRFDNTGISSEIYPDVAINEMYVFNGTILGYVYDRIEKYNKLVRYDSGKFINILTNFDVVDTYEFGNSRVFYGYDNSDKKYKLYRFDGRILSLIVDDCYSSVHINFKDSIILNKYDSSRNYSIIKIDNYWNVTILDTKKTIREYFISDDWLYIKTRHQEESGLNLLVFDGSRVVKVESLSYNDNPVEDIAFDKIRICGGNIYALLQDGSGRKLFRLIDSKAYPIYDPIDMTISFMEAYNERLYFSCSYKAGSVTNYALFEYNPETDLYNFVNDSKFNYKNIKFEKALVKEGTLFLTGKFAKYGINDTATPTEDVMYVYRDGIWNYAVDVKSISSVIRTDNGLYVKVKDLDRSTSKTRDSVLFIDNDMEISNAAIDFSISKEAVIGSSFIFAGANNITRRSAVSSHDMSYHELLRGFSVNYWETIRNKVYTGGSQDSVQTLYSITGAGANIVKANFDVKTILPTRYYNMYLVYGTERDKSSIFNGCKVLYAYNDVTNVFTLVSAGIEIEKILMKN